MNTKELIKTLRLDLSAKTTEAALDNIQDEVFSEELIAKYAGGLMTSAALIERIDFIIYRQVIKSRRDQKNQDRFDVIEMDDVS